MYIGCGRLSIINTEGQMRIFLMTPVGVVVTTRGRERVKERFHSYIGIITDSICIIHNVLSLVRALFLIVSIFLFLAVLLRI